jgi:fructoselysine-6-P-deglycase FrlB-like protein/flavodoxin
MGKPFKKEIERLSDTIMWANDQPIEKLSGFILDQSRNPLFVIGSGGSLSACYFAAGLYQKNGIMAKAITPLELYYSKEAIKNSKVLFISSGGKNADILFGFNIAIQQEPQSIMTLCMRPNSPLSKLANKYSISNALDFDIPSRKDGFLATNSLVAYFIILYRAFGYSFSNDYNSSIDDKFKREIDEFTGLLSPIHTLTVLYGGWGQPIAYDLESKFTEAALGNIQLSDYRNFGHGRHHWFAKRENDSAIVALVTPEEEKIAEKTICLIPKHIPTLVIRSKVNTPSSGIDLLIKSFFLVNSFGELQKIDPGKPGVPEFGRKLFNLKYSSFYKLKSYNKNSDEILHILRKTRAKTFSELGDNEKTFWIDKYKCFVNGLKSTSFGIVILDYDGTICSAADRLTGISEEMKCELLRLLKQNIIIGVATGRGKSVREEFVKFIPEILRENVVIGYYCGADIGSLTDTSLPLRKSKTNKVLVTFYNDILKLKSSFEAIIPEVRPNQITISFHPSDNNGRLRALIRTLVSKPEYSQLEMLESTHSVDIIVKPLVSKLNIIKLAVEKAIKNSKSINYLCIGDRGQWPGNDYELLSSPSSLSVDEVSNDPDTCWNISSLGLKNYDATLEYLKRLQIKDGNLNFI